MVMAIQETARMARFERRYQQYVKPFERDHWGEFALVTPDGQVVLAVSLEDLMEKTMGMDNDDNCLFKVGEISAFSIL
jgi:hypothetical protein